MAAAAWEPATEAAGPKDGLEELRAVHLFDPFQHPASEIGLFV